MSKKVSLNAEKYVDKMYYTNICIAVKLAQQLWCPQYIQYVWLRFIFKKLTYSLERFTNINCWIFFSRFLFHLTCANHKWMAWCYSLYFLYFPNICIHMCLCMFILPFWTWFFWLNCLFFLYSVSFKIVFRNCN